MSTLLSLATCHGLPHYKGSVFEPCFFLLRQQTNLKQFSYPLQPVTCISPTGLVKYSPSEAFFTSIFKVNLLFIRVRDGQESAGQRQHGPVRPGF